MGTFTAARQTAGLTAARNTALDTMLAPANSGSLRIYSGTPPVDATAALSSNILLATLALSATPFGPAAAGVATANVISTATSAAATGTPTFFRLLASDGVTVIFQGTAAATGAELNLTGLSSGQIIAGGSVGVSSLTVSQAASFV